MRYVLEIQPTILFTGAPGIPAFSGQSGHLVMLASVVGVVKVWLGGWNFFLELESSATSSYRNRYYPTATAYLKPPCGTTRLWLCMGEAT